MLRSTPQTVISQADGHSGMGDIRVLSGNPVQTYNRDLDEYEPDRSLVPCVLMPWYNAVDPEGIMVGEQMITGAEWYEGAPNASASNRITSATTGYTISATGKPTYSLSVTKNISPDSPIEIYCIFMITNKKTAVTEKHEASIALRTSRFDSNNFTLKLDMPSSYVVNPLDVEADSDGRWLLTYNAQLYNGATAVADANAVYWWQIKDGSAWRSFSDDEKNVCVTVSNKKLVIDSRFVEKMDTFRVRAAYYATGTTKPTSPPNSAWEQDFVIKIEMPKTIKILPVQTQGAKMNSNLTQPVTYTCRVLYNRAEVTGKDSLFRFIWKGKSGKAGSSEVTIGEGKTITFTPAHKFTKGYPVAVWCEVHQFLHYGLVTCDGSMVVDGDGNAVVQKVYD